jgi:hypothetical protein
MPLDAEEGEIPLPDVSGLAGDDPSLLGVVVSHLRPVFNDQGHVCGLVCSNMPYS